MRGYILLPLAMLSGFLLSCKTSPADPPPGSTTNNNTSSTDMPSPQKKKPEKKPEADDFVGMQISAAQKLADQHRIKHRVVMKDGKSFPITMDYRPDRVNFTVENGVVTKVTNG